MFEKIKFVLWIIMNIAVFGIGIFRAYGRFCADDPIHGFLYVGALIGFVILAFIITTKEIVPKAFPKEEKL